MTVEDLKDDEMYMYEELLSEGFSSEYALELVAAYLRIK